MQTPLEKHTEAWKVQLKGSGIFTEAQLLELEDHLQLEIDRLLTEGQSEEAAFSQASMNIGHPLALGKAYSLNNKHLILKHLGIYFLMGFPLIQGILLFFQYSWKLPGVLKGNPLENICSNVLESNAYC